MDRDQTSEISVDAGSRRVSWHRIMGRSWVKEVEVKGMEGVVVDVPPTTYGSQEQEQGTSDFDFLDPALSRIQKS